MMMSTFTSRCRAGTPALIDWQRFLHVGRGLCRRGKKGRRSEGEQVLTSGFSTDSISLMIAARKAYCGLALHDRQHPHTGAFDAWVWHTTWQHSFPLTSPLGMHLLARADLFTVIEKPGWPTPPPLANRPQHFTWAKICLYRASPGLVPGPGDSDRSAKRRPHEGNLKAEVLRSRKLTFPSASPVAGTEKMERRGEVA